MERSHYAEEKPGRRRPARLASPQAKQGKNREEGTLYRDLFEESHEALIITERDGKIVDANNAASALFGYARAELVGMNIRFVYLNAEDRERFQEKVEKQGFVRDFELAFHTSNGRRLDCLVTTTVRRATDGTVAGYQGIIFDISERKRMEKKLHKYQRKLQSLTVELSRNAEHERRCLADNLHDGLGQDLVLAQLKLETLRHANDSDHKALIADLQAVLDRMSLYLRSVTFDLTPPMLHDLGLIPALEWLSEHIEQDYGLKVELKTNGDCEVPDQNTRDLTFRCIRELLHNAARHANTDLATVSLCPGSTHLQVLVEDTGQGFDLVQLDPEKDNSHFGLFSIREHLTYIGGHFAIESSLGQGTSCLLTIPFSLSGQEDNSQ